MNWQNTISQLVDGGMSVKEIAQATGLAASSVYDLRSGRTDEPRGMAAVRLYALLRALRPDLPDDVLGVPFPTNNNDDAA